MGAYWGEFLGPDRWNLIEFEQVEPDGTGRRGYSSDRSGSRYTRECPKGAVKTVSSLLGRVKPGGTQLDSTGGEAIRRKEINLLKDVSQGEGLIVSV